MKNLLILGFLFGISTISVGQSTRIIHDLFDFRINSSYEIFRKDSSSIEFKDTLQIDNVFVLRELTISLTNVSPEKNGIKTISDFANFDKVSMSSLEPEIETKLEGVSKIANRDIYFYYNVLESFSDQRNSKLIGYRYSVNYYFLESSKIYRLEHRYELLNGESKEYDRYSMHKLMRKNANIGELNQILTMLKIKK